MQIKNMFTKRIDRDIKGVIKVGQGDDANVQQELAEYVVTRELQKHFADFFANYKAGIVGNTDKMGVWISGFFGSGKSHFLKILSYLLDNRVVDGKRAIDYFVDEKKITDPYVLADMKLAANTPTDVMIKQHGVAAVDANGKMPGRRPDVKVVTKKSVEAKALILKHSQDFNGTLCDLDVIRLTRLSRNTYYKYKRELREDSCR